MGDGIFWKFIAAVGILIMTLTGVCTLGTGATAIFTSFGPQGDASGLLPFFLFALLLGGLPFLSGFFIYKIGRKRFRKWN